MRGPLPLRVPARHRPARAAATPNPTIAGTSSMPPRRARSCAPPSTKGGNRRPRRTSSAPVPFGPPNLCAVTEQRSALSAEKSTGTCPAAAHASTWTMTSRSLRTVGDLGRRLERAHLVVGELHRDQRGVGADRVEHLAGVEPAGAVHTDRGDVGSRRPGTRFQDRRVLDRGGHDVSAAVTRDRTPDRGVHRLGAARREHHLSRSCAEERGDGLARLLDRDPCRRDPPRGDVPDRRDARGGTATSRRAPRGGGARTTRDRGRRGALQTRATHWSSPSGRLDSNRGDVSP